ncbi:hypothetical protein SO802_031114 [Lithocarpus litseifolius]|uniref:Reverse transcriptase domain-containing protein n=1 Tax=Lithocarpus litseifolius TaxID=425828 RepID=A0AAW2BLC0_9ROSI
MLGDFSEVLIGDDKFGGRHININRALEFKDCVDTYNFLDLGFSGPKFTWSNKRQVSNLILERIDRCFVNPVWRILYLEASVTHLPRIFSDHCPVLIELCKPVSNVLRQHRNKIRCIKTNYGDWISDEEGVKDHILSSFRTLYTTSFCMSSSKSPVFDFSCCYLSEEEKGLISKEVTDEEIKVGLWALKPFKAPGVDGLHAEFFQHFWHEVKNSVCTEVRNVFLQGVVPGYLNETLISLIPKCQNPESLGNYRPIGLCNSVYKFFYKIVVARIRPYLSNLIFPVQAVFVPRRKGIDNVLIAQELIHSLDNKKGKVGFMAIKMDLEKAYDRLEWNFIHKVLQAFHFPHNLIKLDPMKASRENVEISHFFFTDNLILLAKVDDKAYEAISDVLDNFCNESIQKVSTKKSRIYFSPNVKAEMKVRVCDKLGIQATSNFGKYLDFPLRNKGAARNQFNFIAERVINKLSSWNAKFLFFAGRTILVKFVMAAIPNYVMQGAALSAHLCDKLDKINKDFLWGSSSEKRKLQLVGWNKIVKPKEEGGLGIQSVRGRNLALLSKLNWRLYQEKEALWAKIIITKYCSTSRRNSKDPDKLPCSPNWTAIKMGFPIFSKVYPLCKCQSESIIHMLRECGVALDFWRKIGVPYPLDSSFKDNMCDWLKTNCLSKLVHQSTIPSNILFPFAIWSLWKHINSVVFENTTLNPKIHTTCINQALEYFLCISKTRQQKHKIAIHVRWNKPPTGWFKLNTDGASFGILEKPGREASFEIHVVTGLKVSQDPLSLLLVL